MTILGPVRAPEPTPHRSPGQPTPVHLLAKPTGAVCNLDCSYCFYLSKEALYPLSPFRMSDAVMRRYIDAMIAQDAAASPRSAEGPTITWQGGEPTMMGLDFFRRAARYAVERLAPGQRIQWAMQTNGVLLTDEWCEFLREHDYLVGLSIDGPEPMHDAYRVDKAGRGSFTRVMRGARLLRDHGVEFNTLTTVHRANEQHGGEVYRFLRDEVGSRFMQFIPIVEPLDHTPDEAAADDAAPASAVPDDEGSAGRAASAAGLVSERSVTSLGWGDFLNQVFDAWAGCDVGAVHVMNIEWALASWCGLTPAACMYRSECGDALALEHTGDVYSCDHYVEPGFKLGTLMRDDLARLASLRQQREFGAAKRTGLPGQCVRCPARFACHGECPKNRIATTSDGEAGLNYLCDGYLAYFGHIDEPLRFLARVVLAGGDPRRLMAWMRRNRQLGDGQTPAEQGVQGDASWPR